MLSSFTKKDLDHPRESIRILLPILLFCFLAGSCKKTVNGPDETANSTPSVPTLQVAPHIGYINQPITFTAIPYNFDSNTKYFHWLLPGSSTAINSGAKNSTVYTITQAGTYQYIVIMYEIDSDREHDLAIDTESLTVYLFASSIKPSIITSLPNTPHTFQVLPVSVITGSNYTYVWQMGSGTKAITLKDTNAITYTFPVSGSYVIDVKIYDDLLGIVSEATGVANIVITVQGMTANPQYVLINEPVHFAISHSPLSNGNSYYDSWNFGDGDTLRGLLNKDTLSYSYSRSGTYLVIGSVYDASTNQFLGLATDTVYVSAVDASQMSLVPPNPAVQSGKSILFTVHHPQLDTRHSYHWEWITGGTPEMASRSEGFDTLSAQFVWGGTDSIQATLVDDSLGLAIGSARTAVQVSLPAGFSKALLLSMNSVKIEFVGDHQYTNPGSYLGDPGNDWEYDGIDTEARDLKFVNDSVCYFNGSSQSTIYGQVVTSVSRGGNVTVVVSQDGTSCLYGYGASSYHELDQNYANGVGVYSNYDLNGSFAVDSLPLISFSSNYVQYGIRGAPAASHLAAASFSNSASWTGVDLPSTCAYISTPWNSNNPASELLITFRK